MSTPRLPRFLVPIVVAALLAATGARADAIAFSDMVLDGSATISGSALSLTQAGQSEIAGSAFVASPFALGPDGSFSAEFQFQITPGPTGAADGFTFVLAQSIADESLQPGGNLGYLGLANSVAIEFDTYYHESPTTGGWPISEGGANDLNDNHVAVDEDGLFYEFGQASPYGVGNNNVWACGGITNGFGCLADNDIWTAMVGYENGLLSVSVQDGNAPPDLLIDDLAIDIPTITGTDTPYIGFTGAVGGLSSTQDILSFELAQNNQYAPVPEPGSLALLATGVACLIVWRRRARIRA